MRKIRVLIVEDSDVIRQFLQHLIARDPRLEVAAAVRSAEEALQILDRAAPDVISMDIRLPGMNGFEATRRIMSEKPTPIVVVSASVESEDLKITMNALQAGALTVVEKPVGTTHGEYETLAERLCTQLAIMSQVKVVRQRVDGRPRRKSEPPSVASHPILDDRSLTVAARKALPSRDRQGAVLVNGYAGQHTRVQSAGAGPLQILGVVASTGGPNALVPFLGALGPDFALPVLLVQHITASFLDGFVSWLDGVCPLTVAIAKDGEMPALGRVYVPPADRHLRLEMGCLRIDSSEPVSAQRPSGTVLFRSMAQHYGDRALGVLLTGMGEDGALGLLDLRKAGGYTIAEDESTAVVYGMPGAAVRLGAACESLPLPAIGPRVLDLVWARNGGS